MATKRLVMNRLPVLNLKVACLEMRFIARDQTFFRAESPQKNHSIFFITPPKVIVPFRVNLMQKRGFTFISNSTIGLGPRDLMLHLPRIFNQWFQLMFNLLFNNRFEYQRS